MTDKGGRSDQPLTEPYDLEHLPGFDQVPRDMQDALKKFNREAEQIPQPFLKNLESREVPPVIYHYTNDLGLRGILETGELWLTDIFSLNDPSELSHGFSHAIKTVNAKVANGPPESKIFAKNFAAFAQQRAIRESAHYFLCSFSSRGDDLGQWRAYADNGRGYALGFDAKILEDGFTKHGDTPISMNSTFYVTYKDSELVEIHRQIVEKMFDLISMPRGRGLQNLAINVYMAELQMLLTLHTLRASLFFKHEAYINEQEFRFLQIHKGDQGPPQVELKVRPYTLVRYRKFDWKSVSPTALKQIVIGPAADKEKAPQFARDCLRSFYTSAVEVTRSEIPYRAG